MSVTYFNSQTEPAYDRPPNPPILREEDPEIEDHLNEIFQPPATDPETLEDF